MYVRGCVLLYIIILYAINYPTAVKQKRQKKGERSSDTESDTNGT